MKMTSTPGNWEDFSHFLPGSELRGKEKTHHLWYYGNNVNAPVLSESNGAAIAERLKAWPEDFNLSTVGGALRGTKYHSVLVRVRDEQGNVTPAAVELEKIKSDLESLVVLDDEDYSERCETQNVNYLEDEIRRLTDWGPPQGDYPEAAWRLYDHFQREGWDVQSEDWMPDHADLLEALPLIGMVSYKEEE